MKIDIITEYGHSSFQHQSNKKFYVEVEEKGYLYEFELYFDGRQLQIKKNEEHQRK